MITLALFRQLAEDLSDELTKDKDLFWEEMPLQQNGKPASGVWIVTRGGSSENSPKGLNLKTTVDFYVAFANKVKTEYIHGLILEWLITNPCFCELSGSVSGTKYSYDFTNVRVRPTTTPQNDGVTENGLIVKIASAQIIYDQPK